MSSQIQISRVFLDYLMIGLLCMAYAGVVNAGQNHPGKYDKSASARIYGKVTQTMDAAGYTYAEVDTGKEKVWGAARNTVLKKGDMIAFSTGMPMKNYFSKSLNREFSVVYFVDRFITDKKATANGHPAVSSPHANIKIQSRNAPVEAIKKVEGGFTIGEVYKNKKSLKGKTVSVRGVVTKFTAEVMGKNWIHIMDSSSSNDLTVTTQQRVKVNDVIVIKGTLALDKDFNYGYVYPLIVENASILR